MKTIIISLAIVLAVSFNANAGKRPETKPAFRNFNVRSFAKEKEETVFSSAKKIFKGLTNIQFGKNLKVGIITPGPNVKMKISKGIYPECYPARFSMKLYYSF